LPKHNQRPPELRSRTEHPDLNADNTGPNHRPSRSHIYRFHFRYFIQFFPTIKRIPQCAPEIIYSPIKIRSCQRSSVLLYTYSISLPFEFTAPFANNKHYPPPIIIGQSFSSSSSFLLTRTSGEHENLLAIYIIVYGADNRMKREKKGNVCNPPGISSCSFSLFLSGNTRTPEWRSTCADQTGRCLFTPTPLTTLCTRCRKYSKDDEDSRACHVATEKPVQRFGRVPYYVLNKISNKASKHTRKKPFQILLCTDSSICSFSYLIFSDGDRC